MAVRYLHNDYIDRAREVSIHVGFLILLATGCLLSMRPYLSQVASQKLWFTERFKVRWLGCNLAFGDRRHGVDQAFSELSARSSHSGPA